MFYFRETSHMLQKFMKMKSSRIGEITLSFTDIGKSRSCREFSTSQIYVLTLFAKISYLQKKGNKRYFCSFWDVYAAFDLFILFVWTFLFIGTKSRINNIHIRKHVYKLSYKHFFV